MKKSFLTIACTFIAFSMVLTACGGNNKPAQQAQNNQSTASGAPKKPVKLQMVTWGSQPQVDLLNSVIKKYTDANPNTSTEVIQSTYADFTEKVTAMIASGNPPDVTWWTEDTLQWYAEKGYFLELDSAMDKWGKDWDKEDFYPSTLAEGKFKDKQYAIPFSSPAHVLFYNKKLFDQAGIKYPDENWTWDDVEKAAKTLTKGEGSNKVYGITNLLDKGTDWQQLLDIIRAYGGKFMNDDRTKCVINSPETITALKKYMDLQNGGYATMPRASAPFEQGKAAMFLGYLSYNGTFVKAPDLDYDITYVPKGPKGRSYREGYAAYVVMKTTKNPNEALDFMRFMTSKETCKVTSQIWGPSRKSVGLAPDYMSDVAKPANKQIFIKALEFAAPTEHFPQFMKANTMAQEEMDKMLAGAQTVEVTTANIEKRVNELLGVK